MKMNVQQEFVTRYVKGPKPMWTNDHKTGEVVCVEAGQKIEVSQNTATSKAHLLFTPKEFVTQQKAAAAGVKASQAEKAERKEETEAAIQKAAASEKAAAKAAAKGDDSKES